VSQKKGVIGGKGGGRKKRKGRTTKDPGVAHGWRARKKKIYYGGGGGVEPSMKNLGVNCNRCGIVFCHIEGETKRENFKSLEYG